LDASSAQAVADGALDATAGQAGSAVEVERGA
jgi:hypothetical protein